jgi:hypothetical protein
MPRERGAREGLARVVAGTPLGLRASNPSCAGQTSVSTSRTDIDVQSRGGTELWAVFREWQSKVELIIAAQTSLATGVRQNSHALTLRIGPTLIATRIGNIA